jgi:RHS repeat-associated protein
MWSRWINALLIALGTILPITATAANYSYELYTNAQGGIFLKTPKQFMLLHGDVSIPMMVMPSDGYLQVLDQGNGQWATQSMTAEQWQSQQVTLGAGMVADLQFADLNGDNLQDMLMVVRGQSVPFIVLFRQSLGGFRTVVPSAGSTSAGATYHLRDVNNDGLLDIVDSQGSVHLLQPSGQIVVTDNLTAQVCPVGSAAAIPTRRYELFTGAEGGIFLKAPKQFVLLHSDVSVPLMVAPADGYLQVLDQGNGHWATRIMSEHEWQSRRLQPGAGIVDDLKYADLNCDGQEDIVLALRGQTVPFVVVYRQQQGGFRTVAAEAGAASLGPSIQLRDVNNDRLLDIIDSQGQVHFSQFSGQLKFDGNAADQVCHVGSKPITNPRRYQYFTNSQGEIFLKAPKQFVLLHADVTVPLMITPTDTYLKVQQQNSGQWSTLTLTEQQWLGLELFQGAGMLDELKYTDLNCDGEEDMLLSVQGQSVPFVVVYRQKQGSFRTVAAAAGSPALGTGYHLRDVNKDGILDIVDSAGQVHLSQLAGSPVFTGKPADLQESNHPGLTAGAFRVDESGQVSYSIPLAIPAGIAGVQPQVSLSYNSGAADGIAGMGWSLSGTSMISRCGKTIAQDGYNQSPQYTKDDAYCLDGQRLLYISGDYGAAGSLYRLEIDDFSRIAITANNASGPTAFSVVNKANETHLFGGGSSDYLLAGHLVATGWAVSQIKDQFNNAINFSYYQQGPDGATAGEFLLKEISYAYGKAKILPFYQADRSPQLLYSNGVAVKRKHRLDYLHIKQDDESYRFYHLGYQDNAFNYLNSVQECLSVGEFSASGTQGQDCKKELRFDYQSLPGFAMGPGVADVLTTPVLNTSQFADVNGDGIADAIYTSADGKTLVSRINGVRENITTALAGADQFTLADLNGDSYPDFVYVAGGSWRIRTYSPNSSEKPQCLPRYKNSQLRDPKMERCTVVAYQRDYTDEINTGIAYNGNMPMFADVDGDGLVDWTFFSNKTLQAYRNLGGSFNSQPITVMTLLDEHWPKEPDDPGDGMRKQAVYRDLIVPKQSVGDFNGDGNADILLTLSTRAVFVPPATAPYPIGVPKVNTKSVLLINNGTQNLSYRLVSLDTEFTDAKLVDLNSDMLTDVVYKVGSTLYYRLSNGGNSAPFEPATPLLLSDIVTGQDTQHLLQWVDLDQNGILDLIAPNSETTRTYICPGNPIDGVSPYEVNQKDRCDNGQSPTENIVRSALKMSVFWGSRDHQGQWYITAQKTDLLLHNVSAQTSVQLADAEGDGDLDLYTSSTAVNSAWTLYKTSLIEQKPVHKLTKIINGYGVSTAIRYQHAGVRGTDAVFTPAAAFDANGNVHPDYLAPQSGMWLVSSVSSVANKTMDGTEQLVTVDYRYKGFLVHKKGRGSLGFAELSTIDKQSGIVTTTKYLQHWPFIGRPAETISTASNGTLLSKAISVWDAKAVADEGVFVYLKSSVETGSQLGSNGSAYQVQHVETSHEYDQGKTDATAWGNLTKTIIKQYNPQVPGQLLLTTQTDNSYEGWGGGIQSKRFARLSQATVTKTQYALEAVQAESTLIRRSDFTYHANGLLASEAIASECAAISTPSLAGRAATNYCDHSNYRKTSYQYNSVGLKTATTVTTSSGTRSESVEYSADYRVVLSRTDAAGLTEHYLYNGTTAPTGLIYTVTVTDPNQLTRVSKFNRWGENYQQISADGNITSTYLESCASSYLRSFCQNNDKLVTRLQQPGSPLSAEITDSFGRLSKKLQQGFDGNWKQTAVSYDAEGRLSREYQAEPAQREASAKFTSYSYDRYGRLQTTTHADGSTVEIDYQGLRTRTKDEEGYWRDEIKDALGRTILTTDPYLGAEPALTGKVQFWYDAFGNVLQQQVFALVDSAGQVTAETSATQAQVKVTVSHAYDRYGRKLQQMDTTKGSWLYGYNGFDELTVQRNGRGEFSYNNYDNAGRLLTQQNSSELVCYSYGRNPAARDHGKLLELSRFELSKTSQCATTVAPDYQEKYSFDRYGRPELTHILSQPKGVAVAKEFLQGQYYDSYGRVSSQILPNSLQVYLGYNAAGYQDRIVQQDGTELSAVTAMDDAGRITAMRFVGNAARSVSYQPERGFIDSITAMAGGQNVYQVSYSYNNRGDTKTRNAVYQRSLGQASSVNESFSYRDDGHQRLAGRALTVSNPAALGGLVSSMTETFSYDSLGNLRSKSGVGRYQYDTANPLKLLSTSGSVNNRLAYDAHGNVLHDGSRSFGYNQQDMVTSISKTGASTNFSYAPDNQRIYRKDVNGSKESQTWYVGKSYELLESKVNNVVTTEHRWYLGPVVVALKQNSSLYQYEVLHGDAQGSTAAVTNGSGQLVAHYLHDAWGKQSEILSGSASQLLTASAGRRGYTGHEHVADLGIIHMNGRIYDPVLARFVQADPTLQFPEYSQGYNRYSYVLNNPMTYTDPSGYFVKWMMKKTGTWDLLQAISSVPLLDAFVTIALNFIPGCTGWCAAMYVAAFQTAKTYAVTGSLGAGLRAGLFSLAAPGGANFSNAALNFIADGVSGGIFSVLQGGKFGHGFISSAVGNQMAGAGGSNPYMRIAVSAIVGGTISSVTGGKFVNGAASAAFATAMRENKEGAFGASQKENVYADPTDPTDDVVANPGLLKKLKFSDDGKTLSGDITVGCYSMSTEACNGVVRKLSMINQTTSGRALKLNITVATGMFGGFFAKQNADLKFYYDDRLTENGNANFKVIRVHSRSLSSTFSHEMGHFLGLGHQLNKTNTIMSYAYDTRSNSITDKQMINLFRAYGGK